MNLLLPLQTSIPSPSPGQNFSLKRTKKTPKKQKSGDGKMPTVFQQWYSCTHRWKVLQPYVHLWLHYFNSLARRSDCGVFKRVYVIRPRYLKHSGEMCVRTTHGRLRSRSVTTWQQDIGSFESCGVGSTASVLSMILSNPINTQEDCDFGSMMVNLLSCTYCHVSLATPAYIDLFIWDRQLHKYRNKRKISLV